MEFESTYIKQLREEWRQEATRRGFFDDEISRKKLHDNIGLKELFANLTAEDISVHGLCVDDDGLFYFTEEQLRMASVMCDLMRRYILTFPSSKQF